MGGDITKYGTGTGGQWNVFESETTNGLVARTTDSLLSRHGAKVDPMCELEGRQCGPGQHTSHLILRAINVADVGGELGDLVQVGDLSRIKLSEWERRAKWTDACVGPATSTAAAAAATATTTTTTTAAAATTTTTTKTVLICARGGPKAAN
nr:unnamed protein product [Spirometra erinaceieuropaei]